MFEKPPIWLVCSLSILKWGWKQWFVFHCLNNKMISISEFQQFMSSLRAYRGVLVNWFPDYTWAIPANLNSLNCVELNLLLREGILLKFSHEKSARIFLLWFWIKNIQELVGAANFSERIQFLHCVLDIKESTTITREDHLT